MFNKTFNVKRKDVSIIMSFRTDIILCLANEYSWKHKASASFNRLPTQKKMTSISAQNLYYILYIIIMYISLCGFSGEKKRRLFLYDVYTNRYLVGGGFSFPSRKTVPAQSGAAAAA